MPLFFIVAGLYANTIQSKEDWVPMARKDVKRLIIPVVVTMLLVILLSPLNYLTDKSFHHVINNVLSLFWSGDALDTRWGTLNSPMWFLVSMFWVRGLFRCLEYLCWKSSKRHDEVVLLISIGLSCLAVQLHRLFPFPTPWGILKGITALSFYSIGWYLKRNGLHLSLACLLVVFWLVALKYGGIDMYKYRYSCYPLDVLGAVGATGLVYLLSKGVCKILPKTGLLLQWFGVNSLLVFCVHCLDRRTILAKGVKYVLETILNVNISGSLSVVLHYSIEIALVVIITFIPFLKRIYGARRLVEIKNK